MDYYKESLKLHEKAMGKWEMGIKVPVETKEDLSLAYTPGVAQPCLEIERDEKLAYTYTSKWNTVAVATDGSAALGLGNIGGLAALPIMEGKAVLFKRFADIDAVPICLESQDVDTIVETLANIASSFGGINLEDISAPRCFEIEKKLQDRVKIPVFHDDQHGTAIVVLAAIINSCRLQGRQLEELEVVISGAGAAGVAIAGMLLAAGVKDVVCCDSRGIVSGDRSDLNEAKVCLCSITNRKGISGTLADAVKDRDVFIGVSQPAILTPEMIKTMKPDPVIFAMSNPEPEIKPELAKQAGAAIIGTGRSDYPNQINNLLAFPGIFRGALDARAESVTEEMKLAAAKAIAYTIKDEELSADAIIPSPLNENVEKNVAAAVAEAAGK
ncbi:MAG: NADP-dependent malic enzyme [Clostridia bacterium]|nr:NADP-dependent malic enzyme [Clostridia bacterium]